MQDFKACTSDRRRCCCAGLSTKHLGRSRMMKHLDSSARFAAPPYRYRRTSLEAVGAAPQRSTVTSSALRAVQPASWRPNCYSQSTWAYLARADDQPILECLGEVHRMLNGLLSYLATSSDKRKA